MGKDPVANLVEFYTELAEVTDEAIEEALNEYCRDRKDFLKKVEKNLRRRLRV